MVHFSAVTSLEELANSTIEGFILLNCSQMQEPGTEETHGIDMH